jgi:hypothetical protein
MAARPGGSAADTATEGKLADHVRTASNEQDFSVRMVMGTVEHGHASAVLNEFDLAEIARNHRG